MVPNKGYWQQRKASINVYSAHTEKKVESPLTWKRKGLYSKYTYSLNNRVICVDYRCVQVYALQTAVYTYL